MFGGELGGESFDWKSGDDGSYKAFRDARPEQEGKAISVQRDCLTGQYSREEVVRVLYVTATRKTQARRPPSSLHTHHS